MRLSAPQGRHRPTSWKGAAFDAKARLEDDGLELVGVDEAGRGPLAGPLVVAAVWLPAKVDGLAGVRDSKLLTAKRREELFAAVTEKARAVSVAWAHPRDIERDNILKATLLAMRRAVLKLPCRALVLVDGPFAIPGLPVKQRPVIDGDAKSLSIASASIVAKVVRDRWMTRLDRRYPGYGFSEHKGYGTPDHLSALRRLGPCAIHRRSYAPVRACAAAPAAAQRDSL